MFGIEGKIAVKIGLQGDTDHGGGQHGQQEQEAVEPVLVRRARYSR
jgi:hypothetical protein